MDKTPTPNHRETSPNNPPPIRRNSSNSKLSTIQEVRKNPSRSQKFQLVYHKTNELPLLTDYYTRRAAMVQKYNAPYSARGKQLFKVSLNYPFRKAKLQNIAQKNLAFGTRLTEV